MDNLFNYILERYSLNQNDIELLKDKFIYLETPAQTHLLKAGETERHIYFLCEGIVKGFQNLDGKIVVQHLVNKNDFFCSLESFMHETPTLDYYETITACKLVKISKTNFDLLQKETSFWADFVKTITNEHLACKMERVKDFQILTAKERYTKFLKNQPELALNVSVDNIASFLGMEPQSLSRIRKQITF